MMVEENKQKSNKKLIILAGVVSAVLCIAGGWWWIRSSSLVSTDDARVKSEIVNVSSKVSGQLEQVLVQEGESVSVGQVIAKIDSQALEVQLDQAKANLGAAQAKLASIKAGSRPQELAQSQAAVQQAAANLENARKNEERSASLFDEGALSAQQRDTARTALEVAQAQYHAATEGYSMAAEGATAEDIQYAEAQVAQAAAAVKNAQLQLEHSTVKSPVAGVVAKKTVEEGEIISVGQPLFSITNLDSSWVEANIEENQIGKVQVGQVVDFKIDSYPGKVFKGEVSDVGSATGSQFALLPSDNTSGNFTKVTQRLAVKIKVVDSGELVLKPGMSAVIDIHVK